MGWLFTQGQSRSELIKRLTATTEHSGTKWETIAKQCVGNHLWTVTQITRAAGESQRFIALYLLQNGGERLGWGYKDVEESMGPCEVTCPVRFLDLAPLADSPYAAAWRERVCESHARCSQSLHVGQSVKLTNGNSYRITSVRPLRAIGPDGGTYRIPRAMLTLDK